MKKVLAKIRGSMYAKVMVVTAMVSCFVVGSCFAEETTIDATAITSAFTSGFNSMVTNSIAMISAMVPIALTLAGVVFLVKKGMSWFKGVAK